MGPLAQGATREGGLLCPQHPLPRPRGGVLSFGGVQLPILCLGLRRSKIEFKKKSWKANVDLVCQGKSRGKTKRSLLFFLFFNFNFFFLV